MIGLSPRGILDIIIVFPIMLVIALVLDILNIILSLTIIGGVILALIGFFTVGLWIILRSGKSKSPDRQKQPAREGEEAGARVAAEEGTETGAKIAGREGAEAGARVAAREGAEVAAKTAVKSGLRVGLRIGAATVLKAIPLVGMVSSVVFGWTVMVLWEFFSDLKNSSPEAGD